MYFHGHVHVAAVPGRRAADLDDLDFFPYPAFGTQYDAEKALDAPIDGFMLSKAPKNVDRRARRSSSTSASRTTQVAWVTADVSNIAAAKDADTSKYTALQKKAAEVIGQAQRITQFLDRDTRPELRRPERACRRSCSSSCRTRTRTSPPSRRRSRTSGTPSGEPRLPEPSRSSRIVRGPDDAISPPTPPDRPARRGQLRPRPGRAAGSAC